MAKLRRRQEEAEDFQMAPMIDMVFLLLVFFMCVSTLASGERVELQLPVSEQAADLGDPAARCVVSILSEGKVVAAGQELKQEQLTAWMKEQVLANPGIKVQVRADAATRFDKIREVLRACAEVGVVEVLYSAEPVR